jgi:hypothetical protein
MRISLRLLTVLAFFGLGLGLSLWFYRGKEAATRRAALSHREVATRVLAEYLAGQTPPPRPLVMSNPFTRERGHPKHVYAYEEAGLKGLRQGFGKGVDLKVVFPDLKAEYRQNPMSVRVDPKTTTPLSYLVAENAFDLLAGKHPECNVIVSLIGLPARLDQVEIWRKPDGPRFALLLPDWRMVGNPETVRAAFKSGKLIAAVLNKPGAPAERERTKGDYRAEFERRFLLVAGENVDESMKAYPQLF